MTFKESEFPQLLETLTKYAKQGLPMEDIVQSVYDLYQKVPLYIGIVGMCLENMLKSVSFTEVKSGNEVYIVDKNFVYCGKIDKITKNTLTLKNVRVIKRYKKNKLGVKINKQKIFKLNRNILKTLWPTLYFKKVSKEGNK